MAVLQTVEKIRKRLGYDDTDLVNDAIEAALESASITLEDDLRTEFARATVQDVFFVLQSREYGARNQVARSRLSSPYGLRSLTVGAAAETSLRLGRGFVDSGETITVTAGNTVRNALGTGEGNSIDLVSPDDFTLLDAPKGLMNVNEFLLSNLYVIVTYTAGFVKDGGCPEGYTLTAAEEWLREAAGLKVTLSLNGNPVLRREALTGDELRAVQNQLTSIMSSRVRYTPMVTLPSRTQITLV